MEVKLVLPISTLLLQPWILVVIVVCELLDALADSATPVAVRILMPLILFVVISFAALLFSMEMCGTRCTMEFTGANLLMGWCGQDLQDHRQLSVLQQVAGPDLVKCGALVELTDLLREPAGWAALRELHGRDLTDPAAL